MLKDKEIRSKFRDLWDRIGEVRDQREHDLDYIVRGKGKRPDRVYHGNADVIADGTSTIHVGDEHLLGNRADVREVIKAAEWTLRALDESGIVPDWMKA